MNLYERAISKVTQFGGSGDLLGQFLPASANPYHHSLGTKDTAETNFRILVTNPVLAALVFPGIGDGFNIDIDVDGELVHHCPNSNIELVRGIRDVGFPGFSCSVLTWGCRAAVERKGLSRGAGPARTGHRRMTEVRA